METQKVFFDENGEGNILCPSCGRRKTVKSSQQIRYTEVARAKCPCGITFTVAFERRKQYRKMVHLTGEYRRQEPPVESGGMIIKNISRTGIGFKTNLKNTLKPGDTLKVTFKLDDADKTVISRIVIVRQTTGVIVGAEFCDPSLHRALAFYLMP